jgi:ATP-dependent DNA helicase RecG
VKLVLSVETKEKDSLMPSNGTKEMSVVLKDVLRDVLKELSERQIVILEMIVRDPSLSAKAMSEKMSEKNTNVERTIERDLAKLKKLGILTRKGGRKNGEWVIVYSPQIASETENQ